MELDLAEGQSKRKHSPSPLPALEPDEASQHPQHLHRRAPPGGARPRGRPHRAAPLGARVRPRGAPGGRRPLGRREGGAAGGDHWVVEKGGREVRIRVRVSRELGTVDFLMADAPPGVELGTFTRVVRNGSGSEFVFTRFYADSTSEIEMAEQEAVVAVELQTVRALCESAHTAAAAA